MSDEESDNMTPPAGVHDPFTLIATLPLDEFNERAEKEGMRSQVCCEGKQMSFNDDYPIGMCPYHSVSSSDEDISLFTHNTPGGAANHVAVFTYKDHPDFLRFMRDPAYTLTVVLLSTDQQNLIVIFTSSKEFHGFLIEISSNSLWGQFSMAKSITSVYAFRSIVFSASKIRFCLLLKKTPRSAAQSLFAINEYEIRVFRREFTTTYECIQPANSPKSSCLATFVEEFRKEDIEGMMIEGPVMSFLPGQVYDTFCFANLRDGRVLRDSSVMISTYDTHYQRYVNHLNFDDPQVSWLDLWYYNIHGVVTNAYGSLIAISYETCNGVAPRHPQKKASILLFGALKLNLLREIFSPVCLVMTCSPLFPAKGCFVNFLPHFSPCGSQMVLLRTECDEAEKEMERHIDVYSLPISIDLQGMCRVAIRRVVVPGKYGTLPLPKKIIRFLTSSEE